ncbi:MAG TPA: hypothetical protein VK886_05710 [Vicinamibacterales bacterium]|nr:hypothetical protein [Vicinamibacterales bacterium]
MALRQALATPEEARIIARTFATAGFEALLRRCGDEFTKNGALVVAARCYSQAGEKDTALALLESCADRRCSALVNLPVEPDFDVLRSEPRFQALVRKVGSL